MTENSPGGIERSDVSWTFDPSKDPDVGCLLAADDIARAQLVPTVDRGLVEPADDVPGGIGSRALEAGDGCRFGCSGAHEAFAVREASPSRGRRAPGRRRCSSRSCFTHVVDLPRASGPDGRGLREEIVRGTPTELGVTLRDDQHVHFARMAVRVQDRDPADQRAGVEVEANPG